MKTVVSSRDWTFVAVSLSVFPPSHLLCLMKMPALRSIISEATRRDISWEFIILRRVNILRNLHFRFFPHFHDKRKTTEKNLRYWHRCFLQSCSYWVLGRSRRDSLWTKCRENRMWRPGDISCERVQRHPTPTPRHCTVALNTCQGCRAVRGR